MPPKGKKGAKKAPAKGKAKSPEKPKEDPMEEIPVVEEQKAEEVP